MDFYRIYADGTIVYEDEFEEMDNSLPYYDDYAVYSVPEGKEECWDIPEELRDHILGDK